YGGHLTQNPHIVDPTHPIVKGLTDDILANWYYSAHGYFTNLPENARIIIVDHAGYPIYIEYKYGAGTVLATMMTIEWPFVAYWWGLGEPQQRLLRNEIEYAQMLATHVDLWISNIVPVQVVYDVDINNDGKMDLVQGKKTAVFVYVEGFENLSDNATIDVNLTFEGVTYSESKSVSGLRQDNRIIFYVTPRITGDQRITAIVDPFNRIKEISEANNQNETIVTVKDTRGLHISYFRVNSMWPANYGAPTPEEFRDTAEHSGIFIRATYPVAESEFINEILVDYYGNPIPGIGLTYDLVRLAYWKWILGAGDRAVGVVSDAYFPYHHINAVGLSNPSITKSAVLVTNEYWTVTAHEIAHTYGLNLPRWVWLPPHWESTEEYDVSPPGNPASGYWVEERRDIINGLCFMGYAPPKRSYNYWDGRPVWVCNETYSNLFRRFRVNQADPNVLLIGGIVYKNGTINVMKLYYLENRTIEYPIPGNYSIIATDWNGREVERIDFDVAFYLLIEPYGVIETNITGFVFPIPFPENVSKITIQHENITVLEINPNTKLLHDAIDSIPDYGFINNPDQRRNALHNKINAVEKMLEKKNFKGAVEKLDHDIRDKLEKWLVDYEIENPEQLTKNAVISLVDEIIRRLSLQI
ncbi:hypothetical protein D6D85_05845, partial [Candidatus Methanodesulfokora washburnensis]